MVVEDEFIVAQDLIASLTGMGYEVCAHADSGEKAIQQAERTRPDLVIMDIVLKGEMDGIQAAGYIHDRFQIPVIFLTAFGNQTLLDRAKSIEPFGYLIKPFNEGELHSALEIGLYKAAMEKRLRLSEKRFKTMAELLPTGIFQIERNHKITYMNSSAFKMLGVFPEEYDMDGSDIRDLLRIEGQDRSSTDVSGLIDRGPAEYRLKRKDGSTIMVIADAARMPGEEDGGNEAGQEMGRFLVNLTDITQIKKLEFQLHQAQKMEAIGRLVGGIAHDFNNILYIILGYSELLMGNMARNHPHYEGLKEIFTASERARLLVKQLMAFGRKQVLKINWVDINQVILDFEKMLGRVIGEDIELRIRLTKHPAIVKADVTQIEQILMNLVVNARDAMPDGGILTIGTSRVELDGRFTSARLELPPGDYIMIAVGDTGTGMDQPTIEKIFEPFFTTKSKEAGTGLGLSTVYGIVKQHDGHVDVYSEPGQGSTFKIYLPSFTDDVCIVPSDSAQQHAILDGTATVMVVEDDPSVLRMTGTILSESGYTVIEALNADNAIRRAKEHEGRLHLLLTDVIMPGMKGPEVYQRILEYHPEAKALFMSGYTADVITRHGVLEEGLQFIQKPFSAKTLLATVERIISESAQGG
jgi:two-component system, cell cycle sensor histidine kinase and response regulator CckA